MMKNTVFSTVSVVFRLLVAALPLVSPLSAEPRVAVTIAPVHSWVSMVAGSLWEPDLLLDANTDPHNASLRPSQQRNIQQADWLIWVGPQLESGLADLIGPIPEHRAWQLTGERVDLIHREFRSAGIVYAVDPRHGHSEEAHDEHEKHEERAEGPDEYGRGEKPDDEHGHAGEHRDETGNTGESNVNHGNINRKEGDGPENHAHEDATEPAATDSDHDHGAGDVDPHLWLDPDNARRALQHIATRLSDLDPGNARTYRANAADAMARLDEAEAAWRDRLEGIENSPYAVFHDAYQYFDRAFELRFAGSVTLNPDRLPGLQTIARLRNGLSGVGAECLFAEIQYSDRLVQAVNANLNLEVGRLDALGLDIPPGSQHYFTLMSRLVDSFAACQG